MWNSQQTIIALMAARQIFSKSSRIRTASDRARFTKIAHALIKKAKSSFLKQAARMYQETETMEVQTLKDNLSAYKDMAFVYLWLMSAGVNFYEGSITARRIFEGVLRYKKLDLNRFSDQLTSDDAKLADNIFIGSKLDSRAEGFDEDQRDAILRKLVVSTYTNFNEGFNYLLSQVIKFAEKRPRTLSVLEKFWDYFVSTLTRMEISEMDNEQAAIAALAKKVLKGRSRHHLRPDSVFSDTFRATQRLHQQYERAIASAPEGKPFNYGEGYFSHMRRIAQMNTRFQYFNHVVLQNFNEHLEKGGMVDRATTVSVDDPDRNVQIADRLSTDDPIFDIVSQMTDVFDYEIDDTDAKDEDGDLVGEQTREGRATVGTIQKELVGPYKENPTANREKGELAARTIFEHIRNKQLSQENIRFLLENLELLTPFGSVVRNQNLQASVREGIYAILFRRGFLTAEEQSYLYGQGGLAESTEGQTAEDRAENENIRKVNKEIFTALKRDLTTVSSDFVKSLLALAYQSKYELGKTLAETLREKFRVTVTRELEMILSKFESRDIKSGVSLTDALGSLYEKPITDNTLKTIFGALVRPETSHKYLIKASKLNYLNKFVGNAPSVILTPRENTILEMAKDSEFFTIAKDAKRLTSIEYRRHPLSNFSPEQYLQITRSQAPDLGNDNSPAFAVYLKSLMTDDLFKSIKKKYKDATSSGVSAEDAIDEVLMSHELEQVLDAAVHQYTGSQYNSVFLAQRTRKYPDEISKERALRAIREEIKQNSSLKGAELLTENRKAQRSRKERAIEKGADLINAEIRSISLNGEPALLLARGSFVEADAVSEKLTPIDKASYQKLKNLYIELFLLDDQTLAKEKVSSSFGGRLLNKKAEIEAKINAIRAKGDGASVEELEELEQLDAGIHPLNIELKKIYAAFRKAVNGELENIRREKGPNYRARPYNGRLEEKKSIILREAKKLIIQAVETSDDPSHLRTPLERMNDLRTRLGERGLLEIFREAKIYSNPRDEVLTHISNILSDKTLLNQLPSFNGVTKAREILAAFFRLPISGGRLLSASGRLYTLQARAFQNLEVRPVVEDFIRALVTLQKISDGAVPTAGVFAIADLGEVVVPQEWIDWGDNAQRLAIDQLTSYGSTLEISSPDNTIHSVTQDFKLFTLDIAYLIALFSISADERGKFVLRNEQSALVEPLLEKEVFTRISDMITPLNPSEERILTKMLDRAKQSNNVFQNKILTEEGDQATWDDLLDSLSERAYDKIAKEFAKKDMGSFLKAKDKNKVKLLSAVGFAKLLQDEKHYTESDAFIVKVIDIATKDQLRELLEDIEYEIESIDYTQKHIYMMSSFYKGLIEEKLTRIA